MYKNFNNDYFSGTIANIIENKNLRTPQIQAYISLYNFFIKEKSDKDAIIVLPTGVGKTGLISLSPYQISKGRVLIIAPGLTIKDELLKNIDPSNPNNFLLKTKVISKWQDLPMVSEYTPDLPFEVLQNSNIIVLNIHKLEDRLDSSLINRVPDDFFDMIIIDEAHHAEAETWKSTLRYFSNTKVLKVTGTPFRSDGLKLNGNLIYNYSLGSAMANNYTKSLKNLTYVPESLSLTIDDNTDTLYTLEEIYSMGLKDCEWVSRTVAYSKECSKSVVEKSAELLLKQKEFSNLPHKIIAVACSIKHAQEITELYNEVGLSAEYIHSEMSLEEKERVYSKLNNHKIDVIVNVQMLGEGFDHKYLSIAAIFRPFRSELPYIQFIGRILRYINDDSAIENDNIGHIISHENLYLEELWKKYKREIKKSEIIKNLYNDDSYNRLESNDKSEKNEVYDISIGKAYDKGQGELLSDEFLKTELIKISEERELEEQTKIEQIMRTLDIDKEKAKQIVKSTSLDTRDDLRPDKLYRYTRKQLDQYIRFELVPDILAEYNLESDGNELKSIPLFSNRKYQYIKDKKNGTNAAFLAISINTYLSYKLGKRDNWVTNDYKMAYKMLPEFIEYIKTML